MRRMLIGLGIAMTVACAESTTPTSPTSAATATESFSGTIDYLGSAAHRFSVATTGQVEVTLTSVGPLATMALGVGVVTSDGTTCLNTITQNANARSGTTALKGTAVAGTYCVRVYDSGNIPESSSITYEVQVSHP